MYCPNCGKQTSSDQKFCRACGLGLEKITLSVFEQLPTRADENLQMQKQRVELWGVVALSVFGLGVLGLLAYLIAYKLAATHGNPLAILATLGILIVLASGLISVFLFARARELGERASKHQLQPNAARESASTNELLPEGSFEPVPSVTDRTTELLFVEKDNKTKSTNRT